MDIQVNLGALENGQSGIGETFNRLQATLDNLNNDLKPMIESWSGAAQESYVACQTQWNEGAQSLAAVLNSVSRAVGSAFTNYSATHNATIQVWSS